MEAVDRTRVLCADCGAIIDANDGRVIGGRVTVVGGAPGGSGNGGEVRLVPEDSEEAG